MWLTDPSLIQPHPVSASCHAAQSTIKAEDDSQPSPPACIPKPLASTAPPAAPHIDPKDPDDFMRRCCGKNKKTKKRCSTSITRSQHDSHPKYLPTCKNHREQKTFAGRCRFHLASGQTCGRLFRWQPPFFELCPDHARAPDMPCYLLKLPLELRYEIFRHLLPSRPIGSSTATEHICLDDGDDLPGDRSPAVEFMDARTRMAMMPAELNESTKNLLLRVPTPQFLEIMRSYMRSVRQNCQRTDGSSHTCHRCAKYAGPYSTPSGPTFATQYPMPIHNLFRVCRQIHLEAKALLYSTVAFTINICRDGTFMCGRRLLEPRGPDGSSATFADGTVQAKNRFIQTFDWAAVKNYNVDIVVENQPRQVPTGHTTFGWDEEVEIYDIRDYVAVVVSGILGKAQNLCRLQVRLCLDGAEYDVGKVLQDVKVLAGPFERLRNVRQPRFTGVYHAKTSRNDAVIVTGSNRLRQPGIAICSVPSFPDQIPVLLPGIPEFDEYAAKWERCISSPGNTAVIENPPIRAMFTEFKDWYSRLAKIVRTVGFRPGRQAYLHRARVAREQEDVETFRKLQNELIQHWYGYLEYEEKLRKDMDLRMSRMLEADKYPSLQYPDEPDYPTGRPSNASQSPTTLNTEVMVREGIPMTGNHSFITAMELADAELDFAHFYHNAYPQSTARRRQSRHRPRHAQQPASTSTSNPTSASNTTTTSSSAAISAPAPAHVMQPIESMQPAPLSHSFDDWAQMLARYDAGGPGPSTSQRRVESGSAVEATGQEDAYSDVADIGAEDARGGAGQAVDERRDSAAYVGKGKGKMAVGRR